MRPARADWSGGHFRTPLEPLKPFPNTHSCLGHYSKASIDRTLLRDHELPRSWPSETVRIPEYPMAKEPPSPADDRFPWLPFERESVDELRFSNLLENLNRRYGTGSRAGGGRRRSTMRISKGDRDDNTNYEAVAETSASPRKKKAFRFGDPAQNRLRDADSLKRMQSWLACEKVDGGRTKYGDATDLRMAHWIEAHVERVEAEAQARALEEAAKQNKYRRASHYGNIMDKADGAAVMSGYAGNTLSMTSDPTGLPAAMKAEKRRTMAYVKT